MKKLLFFATALLVLAGCNKKDNALNNAPEGTPFEKGQKVTLTVGTGAQQGPNRVAGVDNTAESKIDFKWEENDKILVKVGTESAEFTLTTGVGTATGTFSGIMPASGTTFNLQYPIETPDLSAQVYTAGDPIPADKMLFTASNCTLGTNATLQAQYAMLQLNLYGTDKTVGKIIFKNITANDAKPDTLTCTGGKAIGATSDAATPFYMVVPTGEYKFEVEVWDNAETSAKICSFATSAAKAFTAGQCANMPAKEVADLTKKMVNGHEAVQLWENGPFWATCNVGATTPEGYGDYFAWGETEPYYDTPITNPITWNNKPSGYAWASYFDTNDEGDNFTKYYGEGGKITLDPENDAAYVKWGGNWRMPTKDEFTELFKQCNWTWCDGETTQYNNTTVKGYIVKSKTNSNSIFLPASGFLDGKSFSGVGSIGNYWSSSLLEEKWDSANKLYFLETNKFGDEHSRYDGLSVRPVCPKD